MRHSTDQLDRGICDEVLALLLDRRRIGRIMGKALWSSEGGGETNAIEDIDMRRLCYCQ